MVWNRYVLWSHGSVCVSSSSSVVAGPVAARHAAVSRLGREALRHFEVHRPVQETVPPPAGQRLARRLGLSGLAALLQQ